MTVTPVREWIRTKNILKMASQMVLNGTMSTVSPKFVEKNYE